MIRWVWSLTRLVLPGWFSRENLKFLYRGLGVRRAALWLAREIVRPVFYRETCYVVTHEVRECEKEESAAGHSRGLEHHIVESAQSLWKLQVHLPPHRRKVLSDYVTRPNRIVVFACLSSSIGGRLEVVGYRRCERGMFTGPGLRVGVSDDVLFVRHSWVFPKYRGQQIAAFLGQGTDAYCRRVGISRVCGTIRVDNGPSLRAHTRNGDSTIVGVITFVQMLGGLVQRVTPAAHVKSMVETVAARRSTPARVRDSSLVAHQHRRRIAARPAPTPRHHGPQRHASGPLVQSLSRQGRSR